MTWRLFFQIVMLMMLADVLLMVLISVAKQPYREPRERDRGNR